MRPCLGSPHRVRIDKVRVPMLMVQFTPPGRESTVRRIAKRLLSLEVAHQNFSTRFSRNTASDALKRDDAYWRSSNRDLLHPLSEKLLQIQVSARRSTRDFNDERNLAERARHSLGGRKRLNGGELAAWLCEVNAHTGARGAGHIRGLDVFTSHDTRGMRCAFCPPSDLSRQLDLLSLTLDEWGDYPCFRAILLLVGILAIHPFIDGNGRTARACFNAILEGPPSFSVIPLRTIFDCSDGGFEIRLRDAVFNGSWGPLVSYFTTAIDHC